jgi:hypothetical protein
MGAPNLIGQQLPTQELTELRDEAESLRTKVNNLKDERQELQS